MHLTIKFVFQKIQLVLLNISLFRSHLYDLYKTDLSLLGSSSIPLPSSGTLGRLGQLRKL